MGAQWIERSGTTSPKQAEVVSEIRTAAGRATQILNDLLDLTRSSFGTEIPVARTKTDIASLCQEIADELRAINPARRFEVTHEGDPMGAWCETDETAHRGLQKLQVLRPEGVQRIDSAPGCSPAIPTCLRSR